MKKNSLLYAAMLLLFTSCNKTVDNLIEKSLARKVETSTFLTYHIKQGEHYADRNDYSPIETAALNFVVKFDSSAIYTSKDAVNQYDINKLYGFSDNNAHHHQYSARFGWSWTDNSLHLYAYVYNEGVVTKEDMGPAPLNTEISCSIQVEETNYRFRVNDKIISVPRKSLTKKATGYRLYPYFGGDETAPHDISIKIKNL